MHKYMSQRVLWSIAWPIESDRKTWLLSWSFVVNLGSLEFLCFFSHLRAREGGFGRVQVRRHCLQELLFWGWGVGGGGGGRELWQWIMRSLLPAEEEREWWWDWISAPRTLVMLSHTNPSPTTSSHSTTGHKHPDPTAKPSPGFTTNQ